MEPDTELVKMIEKETETAMSDLTQELETLTNEMNQHGRSS